MTDPVPPALPPEPDPDRVERLREVAAQLVQEIADFGEDSGEQFLALARRARTNRIMIKVLGAVVGAVLVLAGVLAAAVVGVVGNNHRIGQLAHRLDVQQTVTRRNSLCPLYTLLRDSETPAARAAAPDKAAYDHAVSVIMAGYDALHCADFVSVPPSAGP